MLRASAAQGSARSVARFQLQSRSWQQAGTIPHQLLAFRHLFLWAEPAPLRLSSSASGCESRREMPSHPIRDTSACKVLLPLCRQRVRWQSCPGGVLSMPSSSAGHL